MGRMKEHAIELVEQGKACAECFAPFPIHPPGYCGGTGYAVRADDSRICYPCAAKQERADMDRDGRALLYLDTARRVVTNWTGDLSFPIRGGYIRESRHNIGGTRRDFWFIAGGYVWHGYQIGEWSQIARVRRTRIRWIQADHGGYIERHESRT